MRPSKRESILDAALDLAISHGLRAVTLDAVAGAAGITRGGMTYHFRDRNQLDQAMQKHLAQRWEHRIKVAAQGGPEGLSTRERTIAYVTACLGSDTNEMQLIIESAAVPDQMVFWNTLLGQWIPTLEQAIDDSEAMRCFLACQAADGIWAFGQPTHMPREYVAQLRSSLISMIDSGWTAEAPVDAAQAQSLSTSTTGRNTP